MTTDTTYRWPHKDLLDVTQLDAQDVRHLLNVAASFQEINLRPVKKVPTLKGKTVVAQAGSSALSALEDPDGAKDLADTLKELQQTPDYNTAMMNLKSGLVDAVAIDIGVAQYYLSQQG